jgi:hypothetical protein
VSTNTSGTYTFASRSSLDTYGYLYQGSFDPSDPSQNLMTSNDDSGGKRQFLFSSYLSAGSSYILIITTAGMDVVGDFSIRVSGPSSVGCAAFTPTAGERIMKHIFDRQTLTSLNNDMFFFSIF